jgi:hypothetical protein
MDNPCMVMSIEIRSWPEYASSGWIFHVMF